MTYFIRKNNRTIVDLDFTKDDFHVVVCIRQYSKFLLSLDADNRLQFVSDIDTLQKLRGEWWEMPQRQHLDIHDFCKFKMHKVAHRWGLDFVVD